MQVFVLSAAIASLVTSSIPAALEPVAAPQTSRPRSLDRSCRIAFNALQAAEIEILEDVFPTEAEVTSLFYSGKEGLSEGARRALDERFESAGGAQGMRASLLDRMDDVLVETRRKTKAEFNLDTASYIGAAPLGDAAKPLGEFRVAPVEFYVWADGGVWAFGAADVIETEAGWAFTEALAFKGARELVVEGDAARVSPVELMRKNERIVELEHQVIDLKSPPLRAPVQDQATVDMLKDEIHRLEERRAEMHDQFEAERARWNTAMGDLVASERMLTIESDARLKATERLELQIERLKNPETQPGEAQGRDTWVTLPGERREWEAQLARDLEQPITCAHSDLTVFEAVRYLAISTGVPFLVTPDAYERTEGARVNLVCDNVPVADLVGRLPESVQASLFDGLVIVSTPFAAKLFTDLRLGGSIEADESASELERGMRDARLRIALGAGSPCDHMLRIGDAMETTVWMMSDAWESDDHIAHEIRSTGEISLWSVMQIIAVENSLSLTERDGMLIVSGSPFGAPEIAEINEPVERLARDVQLTLATEKGDLAKTLEQLSDVSGVTINAAPDVLALPAASDFHALALHDLPLETALALIATDIGNSVRWQAMGNVIHLMKIN